MLVSNGAFCALIEGLDLHEAYGCVQPLVYVSFNLNLWIFPVSVFGSAPINLTDRGYL